MTDLAVIEVAIRDSAPVLGRMKRWAAAAQITLAMIAGGLILLAMIWRFALPEQPDISALVAGTAAVLVALPVLTSAWHSLGHPSLHGTTDQLIALALIAAWATGDLMTAAILPIMMILGHALEERSLSGSQEAIHALGQLGRHRAHRILADGSIEDVEATMLRVGDQIAIRPGERIPADGTIDHGRSSIDTSLITGESVPVEVGVGAEILAGSIALDGALGCSVSRIGANSTLGKIVELMHVAARSKPPITHLLERYAGRYIGIVLIIAAGTWFLTNDTEAMLAVLVAACPCALVLAVPATAVAAIAVAGRHGILIKGTAFLEELAGVTSVILDKTGTVTGGNLLLVDVLCEPSIGRHLALEIAGSVGAGSSHPVSRAIACFAGTTLAFEQREIGGLGITARLNGEPVALGRPELFGELGISTPPVPLHEGPIVGLAVNGAFNAWLLLADQPKPEARAAIADLGRLGLNPIRLLTGDRPTVAASVADAVGIPSSHVTAGARPADKLHIVLDEIRSGHRPLVVGDGINDSLALKAGAVGIAMGVRGSDIALAAADLVLMTTDLRRLGTAVRLSRRCRQTIKISAALGLGWTITVVALAATGALGEMGALAAAVLHNLGTLLVMGNAARLLRFDEQLAPV